jgi:Tol biopolymer transport system component
MRRGGVFAFAALLACTGAWAAGREAVLKQIDLPHNYYFREMYLPQLTNSPQYPVFSPDGRELVYSLAGSLWRQRIGEDVATEITHGAGYDYQPDFTPDGKRIVFARYDGKGIELRELDLASKRESALTQGGDVNLEPRVSPDGKWLAYVSTAGSGHFELKLAALAPGRLGPARTLVGGRKSAVPRYYYSAFDHAISPSWTPDGKRIVFVSNREVAYGTGDFWSVSATDANDLKRIHGEETTWRATPAVAPDGRRLLFSSYHGRQWHQLWLTTLDGAPPLPLTFGERDVVQARWSPDGESIAYVSNEFGDNALWVQRMAGGDRVAVSPKDRRPMSPLRTVHLRIVSDNGSDGAESPTMPARVSVIGSDGRAYAPLGTRLYADDSFDRAKQSSETVYFDCMGTCAVQVPEGRAKVTAWRGLDFQPTTVESDKQDRVTLRLPALTLPDWAPRRVAADLHVHMNYGGHYKANAESLSDQACAEGLGAVYNLVVNKEERIPDIGVFGNAPQKLCGAWIIQGQEFHSSYWGHLGLLDLREHFLTPDFTAYQGTAMASPWPDNGEVARLAHAQGALVGYAHPFDLPVDPEKEPTLSNEFPADVAMGRVDYYEVVGFSDHRASADVWYRLLNLGYRIPAGAGTDAMTNYASLRGPVGVARVLLDTQGEATPESLHAAIKAGRSVASNSAQLAFELDGQAPGGTVKLARPGKVKYRIAMRSIVPMQHVELVHNGKLVATLAPGASVDAEGEVELKQSGWLVLRAWNEGADPLVFDIYPYASTSPVYVEVGDAKPRSPADAKYFVRWLERNLESAAARTDYNSDKEKLRVLDYLRQAKAKFEAQQ